MRCPVYRVYAKRGIVICRTGVWFERGFGVVVVVVGLYSVSKLGYRQIIGSGL